MLASAVVKLLRFLVREPIVIGIILINAVALFALAALDESGPEARLWFIIDYACVVYFVLEALIKVRLGGMRGYLASGWNRLDLFVVVVSLPFLLAPVIEYHQLGGFTVLRLLRLFRLLRLMRFIPDSDKLAAGMMRSLRASVGVLLGVVLINIILALGAASIFGDIVPEYFGTPQKAVYSMFQIFTLEGWHEVPRLITERTDSEVLAWVARGYFVLAVFGGGILGLSLVNAVFVDQMVLDNNDEVEVRLTELTAEVRALRDALEAGRGQKSSGQEQ